jgi:DNA polymerase-3 subunit delta
MYKNMFDKEISTGTRFNAFMFYGQSSYLVEKYAQDTAQRLASGEEIRKIYFDEYDFKECSNFLSQSSLFSSSNILLIKTNKKIPKKEVDELIHNCTTNPDSFVIFACVGDTDFKTMAKSFTKKTNSAEVRFFPPYDNEAIDILNKEANNLGVKCPVDVLQYLYNMHQKDLALCVNDLKKLSILNEPVTIGIANAQCFGLGAVTLDDFFINLFSGKPVNKDLFMILEEGMNEIQLVNQTTTFIQQLFNINSYLKLYGQLNIIEIWGYNLPKNIANARASIAMKFKHEQFLQMMNFFQELELELKTNSSLNHNSYVQSKFRNFSALIR